MRKHCRDKHPGHLPAARKFLRKPADLDVTDKEFRFIKNMVVTNIKNDIEHIHKKVKNPVSEQDKSKLKAMNNPETKQMLTVQIVTYMIERGMCATENVVDDNDGILPQGFNIRHHGGLFKLSLDRKLDHENGVYCIHFPNIDNALQNINLVALLANVAYKASKKERQNRYDEFNNKTEEQLQKEFVQVWAISQKRTYAVSFKVYTKTPLYGHATNFFREDKKCKAHFSKSSDYWEYILKLLIKQEGRCAVSKLLMSLKSGPWLMSVDAIDPKKGHVRGNLRLVCACNNPTDNSKQNKNLNDTLTSLTTVIYDQYWGIEK